MGKKIKIFSLTFSGKKGKNVVHYSYGAIVQICLSGRVSLSDVWKLVKVGY